MEHPLQAAREHRHHRQRLPQQAREQDHHQQQPLRQLLDPPATTSPPI